MLRGRKGQSVRKALKDNRARAALKEILARRVPRVHRGQPERRVQLDNKVPQVSKDLLVQPGPLALKAPSGRLGRQGLQDHPGVKSGAPSLRSLAAPHLSQHSHRTPRYA